MQDNLNTFLARTQYPTARTPFFSTPQVNEKLRKRTLRSKITKILKDQFYDKCNKQQGNSENNEEKIRQLQDESYKQLINDPIFKQRNLVFSSYNSKQYLPNLKFYETQNLISPELLMDINDQKTVIKVIKNQLTKNDLMEIGEDPAYFIQNPQIRELNWIDDVWLESSNKTSGTKTPRVISCDSHLLKPKVLMKALNYDPLVLKQQLMDKKQEYFQLQNKKRIENFIVQYHREQERQSNIEEKLNKRYIQKSQQSDNRINALYQGVDHHRELNQQIVMEKLDQIKQNLKFKQENDEINQMTQKLRRVCVERQVKVNIKNYLSLKIEKVRSVGRSPKKSSI